MSNINKVGGRDIGDAIRYRLSDTSFLMFSDDELNNHLQFAVVEYSLHRPYTNFYSFNTVVSMQSYVMPGDIMAVKNIDYSVVGDLVITDIAQLDWLYMTGQLRDDAMRYNRDEMQGRWQNLTQGQYRLIQGSWLWLFPVPDDSFGINVEYLAQHTVDSFNLNYPTITFADSDLLTDMVIAKCLEIQVDEILRQGTWVVGQTSVKRQEDVLRKRAQTIRDRIYNRLLDSTTILVQ